MPPPLSISPAATDRSFRLGLIGGNITATRSPALHIACGRSLGRNVTYDLIIPAERGRDLGAILARCAAQGFDGVNVTYPHKEEVTAPVAPGAPVVAAMDAANTVTFGAGGLRAFNTDHAGFVAAWRARFGTAAPGRVLILGAGGVGRALAFGLADLGAAEIGQHDPETARITGLAGALALHAPVPVRAADPAEQHDLAGFDGVVNCTPLGMEGRPGSPLSGPLSGRPGWAFDAVPPPPPTRPFAARPRRWAPRSCRGSSSSSTRG